MLKVFEKSELFEEDSEFNLSSFGGFWPSERRRLGCFLPFSFPQRLVVRRSVNERGVRADRGPCKFVLVGLATATRAQLTKAMGLSSVKFSCATLQISVIRTDRYPCGAVNSMYSDESRSTVDSIGLVWST